jgi:ATP-dependent helicase STH1/SNF2
MCSARANESQAYPDYYQVIANPIAMSQIKRKIGNPSYPLPSFRADMHLLWDNARTYNQEGSWVFNAAEDMQDAFDRMWDEEIPKLEGSIGIGGLGAKEENGGAPTNGNGNGTSAGASGTSTPMYKPAERIPTKIKISIGASRRREQVEMDSPSPSGSEGDDDDY